MERRVPSRQNLLDEDFPAADIAITGNTVIDALLHTVSLEACYADPALQAAADADRDIVLVTTHRRENLHAMAAIGRALHRLATSFPDITFVAPLHPNPAVQETILPLVENDPNVLVTTPLPYNEFSALMNRAKLVVTDSGGVQEEAPVLGKPVLVMRDTTERPEAVSYGTVKLVGTDEDTIVHEASTLLTDDKAYDAIANSQPLRRRCRRPPRPRHHGRAHGAERKAGGFPAVGTPYSDRLAELSPRD